MAGKTIQISKTRDIEFIIRLLEDSKYINELCDKIRGVYDRKNFKKYKKN